MVMAMRQATIVAIMVAVVARADDRDKAAAALALARAYHQASVPVSAAPYAHTSWHSAAAEARRTGKPMFTSVNTDCSRLCVHLAGEYIILHADKYVSDGVTPPDRPRLLLTIPHATQERQWLLGAWSSLPSVEQVRDAERRMKPTIPSSEAIPLRSGELRVIEGGAVLIPQVFAPGPVPHAPALPQSYGPIMTASASPLSPNAWFGSRLVTPPQSGPIVCGPGG
jgi:hypothetical protein